MSRWSRLRQSIRPTRRTSDVDDELALHLELRAEELEKQGLSKDAAHREAAKRFGPRARIIEETREAHSFQWLDNWRRDSAYSIRGLLRRPAFLATGLATLALGIGVNVAIFSLLDGLLLKPLPVPDADRLMAFVETRNGDPTGGNPLRLKDYAAAMRSLATTGGFYSEGMVVRTAEGAKSLRTLRTVGDVATTLGYRPVLGRLPGPTEENVALLGHRYWEQAYGGSPGVLGKTLRTATETIEIIGVLGPEAALIEEYQVWAPMGQEMQKTPRTAGFLQMIARLKPAVDLARANAELATVNAAMRAAYPEEDKGLAARLTPLRSVITSEAARPVMLLAGVVFTVLLIACANLAGLLLARNADRAREAAIRIAIGASRADLIRLYLLESVWLAIPGGALGLLAGAWSLAYLKSLLPEDLPLARTVAIDARVALFALALTLFCALAIGLLPAWQIARLKERPSPLRSVLVVAQVAVSMVLLMTAGLLVHSLMDAQKRPLGFNQDHVLAVQFDFTWDTENAKLQQFYHDVEQAVREVPGVRSAGLIDRLPLEGGSQGRGFLRIRGRNLEESLARQSYGFRAMTNGYITALRVPILRGGLPEETQRQTLINESFAKKYFGDTDPVGQQISFSDANKEPVWYTIAGVVGNIAQNSVETRTFSEVFVPFSRTFWPHAALVVNTEGDAAPVIAAARRVDPFAVIRYAGPLETRLANAWSEPRLIATLLGAFSLAALALVCVGIYGMLAGFVRSRTREFGVRLALGATPGSLTQLSLNHGLRLTAIGLGLGLAGTRPVARFLSKSPDPVAMAFAASLMMSAAGLACFAPARRAAKLDPALVLRHDQCYTLALGEDEANRVMSNLHEQLAHLRQRMAAVTENVEIKAVASGDVTEGLNGEVVETEHGAHFESRRLWRNHQRHGSVYISDLQELPGDLLEAISEGQLRGVDPRKVAYLDTETTGLAGGSGTYAFLIGVGALTEEGFELRHFFMRDYSEESSQLHALTQHLQQFDVLVTYNGRSYDQPLLETRYRMSRMKPPFGRLEHFDLLYGARRLYRLAFESCRLVELENQILGVERIDDVPGSMIPYLYFEFLRTRSAHRMMGIFEHNAFDILTLACLTGIIPRAFHAPLEVPLHRGAEMVGLARWLRAAGRTDEAVVLLRRALDKGLPDSLVWRTTWDCALLEKKRGNEAGAVALFTELTTARNPHQANALEELAKYFEHTEKNYAMALDMADEASRLAPTPELVRRRQRLQARMASRRSARLL